MIDIDRQALMDASLDTNVIIHLYKADFDILFNRFEKLKV